jgi:protein Tob/BTG
MNRQKMLNEEQVENFKKHLCKLLLERFEGHWFIDRPWKGQGYRCLRMNRRLPREGTVEEAARACGLKYRDLDLPLEITISVDPDNVSYR